MPKFDIYRVRVIPQEQQTLFADANLTPSQILRLALISTRSDFEYGDQQWRIADLEELGDEGVYLRLGRVLSQSSESFQDGHFTPQQFPAAVSTNLLIDIRTEVCAIAQRTKLSPTTRTVANQLAKLLNMTEVAKTQGAFFEVNEINNPVPLVRDIDRAESILRMEITFSRPNYFDVDKYITLPMEKALLDSGGNDGKIVFEGKNLGADWCKSLARTAAKIGEKVRVKLRYTAGEKPVQRSLSGGVLNVDVGEITGSTEKDGALKAALRVYDKIDSPDEVLAVQAKQP